MNTATKLVSYSVTQLARTWNIGDFCHGIVVVVVLELVVVVVGGR